MKLSNLRDRLAGVISRSPVLQHVLTLASGTLLAQILAIILNIPLARIYTDYDYGLFTLFTSVINIGYAVAGLRYDLAIMLPKRDTVARVAAKLARRSIVFVSFAFSAGCLISSQWIYTKYDSPLLAKWMIASGIAIFIMAEVQNIQFWMNRKSDYRGIALNRFVQTVAVSAFQLVCAFFVSGLNGLVLGTIFGQMLALLLVRTRSQELFAPLPPNAPSLWEVAKRYKKMPLLNGTNILIDAIRLNGVNFLLANLSVGGLGQYNMANRMMLVPVGLLQTAISQVFFQHMSKAERGQLFPLVSSTLKKLGLTALLAFALVYAVAPWAFTFVFGEQWDEAGQLARALTPWMFMMTMSSPVANLFIVTEKQQLLLIFAIIYCAVPITFLTLVDWELLSTVRILSAIMAILLVGQISLALFTAKHWDRQPPKNDQPPN